MLAVISASSGTNCRYTIVSVHGPGTCFPQVGLLFMSFISRAVLGFSVQNFVQVTGLGTALKILFSGDFDQDRGREFSQSPRQDLPRLKPDLALTRNEVVSLFNAFGKISTSIVQLEKFREMLRKS